MTRPITPTHAEQVAALLKMLATALEDAADGGVRKRIVRVRRVT